MKKMVAAIVVLAALMYGGGFVKFGERTFVQHALRIARTPEAKELGDGILAKVGAAREVVKTKVIARLHSGKSQAAGVVDAAEIDPDDPRNPTDHLPEP